ncbi:MAG: hypothetical protein L0227_09730 [Chloroflexi bacterium]|nr:hypothetical protein [Chloroflexota bacterium]
MSPTTVLLVGLLALLVLIPTRRLMIVGWSRQALTTYYLAVWLLGSAVAVMRAPATFLLPILLIAYLAPFVTLRDGLDRLLRRPPRGPDGDPIDRPTEPRPMKDVTPPDPPER